MRERVRSDAGGRGRGTAAGRRARREAGPLPGPPQPGARAGLPVFVAMPRDTPQSIIDECRGYGAQVELVAGVITDAAKRVQQFIAENRDNWKTVRVFDSYASA